ncbi:hypothetical protein [Bartonella koehlerae]|nr:hypothetical protein [Bartonella koehlerae]
MRLFFASCKFYLCKLWDEKGGGVKTVSPVEIVLVRAKDAISEKSKEGDA